MDFVFDCVSDCLYMQTQIANLVAGFKLLTTIFAQNPVSETFPQHSHQYRWTTGHCKMANVLISWRASQTNDRLDQLIRFAVRRSQRQNLEVLDGFCVRLCVRCAPTNQTRDAQTELTACQRTQKKLHVNFFSRFMSNACNLKDPIFCGLQAQRNISR